MMMRKVDLQSGLFLEDVILDIRPIKDNGEPDPAYVALPCPDGLYKPCWDFTREEWFEAATPEEIAELLTAGAGTHEPTQAEKLAALASENHTLKAQLQALADRGEFIEDCVAEMALKVYGDG